jgi:hypothetical protein
MKRIKSYEINQHEGSNDQVIPINYEENQTMYIIELLRAMSSSYIEQKLIRRKFLILIVIAERGNRVTTTNELRKVVAFKNDQYLADLQDLEERGFVIVTREERRILITLTLSCYEWLSKVLPSFKFIRPKHLIFD